MGHREENEKMESIISFASDNYSHYLIHKNEIPQDMAGTIKYHYEKCKENKIFFNTMDLALEADISDVLLRQYMKNKMPNDRIKVLKIGLAMSLSTPYLLDLLNKYDGHKVNVNLDNILFNTIIYNYAQNRLNLEEVYYKLREVNQENILKMSEKWLKNHKK